METDSSTTSSRRNVVIDRNVTRSPDTLVTSAQESTTPTPGTSTIVRVSSGVHCSQARRRRFTRLEHDDAARAERVPDAAQGEGPVVVGEEDLGDVAGHERCVDIERGQRGGVAVQPADRGRTGLGAGDVEAGACRIDSRDVDTPLRQQARERSGAAADVEHRASTEFVDEVDVDVQIAAIRVERVIYPRQPGMLEEGVGHAPSCPGVDATAHRVSGLGPSAVAR